MADAKISALTQLAVTPAADDELVIVDKSDTTMAASGTDKRLRYDQVQKDIGAMYQDIYTREGELGGNTSVGTFFFVQTIANFGLALAATSLSPVSVIYLDPADYTLGALTTKYRLRASFMTNATAPGASTVFTFGLYPISAVGGASATLSMTAGTVQAGSTVAFSAPAAATRAQGNSGDFTAPAAGYYALGMALSGATSAANATVGMKVRLQVRNV